MVTYNTVSDHGPKFANKNRYFVTILQNIIILQQTTLTKISYRNSYRKNSYKNLGQNSYRNFSYRNSYRKNSYRKNSYRNFVPNSYRNFSYRNFSYRNSYRKNSYRNFFYRNSYKNLIGKIPIRILKSSPKLL